MKVLVFDSENLASGIGITTKRISSDDAEYAGSFELVCCQFFP